MTDIEKVVKVQDAKIGLLLAMTRGIFEMSARYIHSDDVAENIVNKLNTEISKVEEEIKTTLES